MQKILEDGKYFMKFASATYVRASLFKNSYIYEIFFRVGN